MNIVSEITDFQYQILLSTAYIECFKHHINAFDDFGQFASNDNDDDQKPFSAYSKYFDECSLSSEEAVTLKSFEPFQRDDDQIPWYTKIYWVGSESNDEACYPGNIIRAIHILETSGGAAAAGYSK
jgi:hypothetical protein